jgi:hypothetical protein
MRATLLSLLLAVACSGGAETSFDSGSPDSGAADAGADGGVDGGVDGGMNACSPGETRCDGEQVSTCVDGSGFGAAMACADAGICVGTACRVPSAQQLQEVTELNAVVDYIKGQTAWSGPIAWEVLKAEGRARILTGDGSSYTYFNALYHAFAAVPEGHQALYLSGGGCGTLVPAAGYAVRGACGRPHALGVVITQAKAGNLLGLATGELIVKLGMASGPELLRMLADRPMCTSSAPSQAFAETAAAASMVDLLRAGEQVTVQAPDGGQRVLTVPDAPLTGLSTAVSCSDPFGRPGSPAATSSLVADGGVAVIRVPSFVDPDVPFPTNPTQQQFDQYVATFQAKIQAAFDQVKTAPAMIWDVRGNGGGLTAVGLAIASGFPGASFTDLSYCQARIPDTDPPQVAAQRYATYHLSAGSPFAYTGKVAVLIDGFNYSAADYFPLAAKARTQALLVGSATAGAFGATSGNRTFTGPPAFTVYVDLNRCFDAQTEVPLEGHNTVPQVVVDYDPVDLAAGRDTVLERAVSELQK